MKTSDDPQKDSQKDNAKALKTDRGDQLKLIPLLWEEYKYRHDLCWRVLFRLTSAVVILAIVPYLYQKVVQGLPEWVLWVPALLAVALASFGFVLMTNELYAFRRVKEAYRKLKDERLYVEGAGDADEDRMKFEVLVYVYLGILVLLSLINVYVVVTELPR